MPKLTKSVIDKIEPTTRDQVYWDSSLRGFGLRVKPSGSKSYLIQYRNAGGRSRRYTISHHGVMTPDEARLEARQLLASIDRGADPAAKVISTRVAPTMASLAQRYLAEYARPHKKPSSVGEDEALIRRRILPRLGPLKVSDVARDDIAKIHHQAASTPYEANRMLALLSKMFNLAELWNLRPDGSNPCRHIRRYREPARERFLTEEELAAIGAALDRMVLEDDLSPAAALAIRLLALTGCRVNEILKARWEQVDLENGLLRLADAKAGARLVPLGDAALALLEGQQARSGHICSRDGKVCLTIWSLEKSWKKVRSTANLRNARLHDLRHTVGTYSGQGGFNAFVVRDLLGHKTLAMTGRYVERDTTPLRAAANAVGTRIAAALAGGAADPNRHAVTPATGEDSTEKSRRKFPADEK